MFKVQEWLERKPVFYQKGLPWSMCVFCLQSIKSRREEGKDTCERDLLTAIIIISSSIISQIVFIVLLHSELCSNKHTPWLAANHMEFFSMLLVVNDAGIDMPAPHQTHHTKKVWLWWAYILHCLEPIEPLTLFVDSHNSKLPRMHLIWFIKKEGFSV